MMLVLRPMALPASRTGVGGLLDLSHAALADESGHVVMPEAGAGTRFGHGGSVGRSDQTRHCNQTVTMRAQQDENRGTGLNAPVGRKWSDFCKTSIPGSNPGVASILCNNLQARPGAGAPDCWVTVPRTVPRTIRPFLLKPRPLTVRCRVLFLSSDTERVALTC
jgi:hypothetical protein